MIKKILLSSLCSFTLASAIDIPLSPHTADLFTTPVKVWPNDSCDSANLNDEAIVWHYYKFLLNFTSNQNKIETTTLKSLQFFDSCLIRDKKQDQIDALNKKVIDKVRLYYSSAKGKSTSNGLMTLLVLLESNTVHWNKSEKNFTTPFGIYAHYWGKSEPVKHVEKLARQLDCQLKEKSCRRLVSLKLHNDTKFKQKILSFYKSNFIDAHFRALVETKRYSTALSYFLFSVNAGMKKSKMVIRQTNFVKVDHPDQSDSFKRKIIVDSVHSDAVMNKIFISKQKKYYHSRSVRKKKLFLKGWLSRADITYSFIISDDIIQDLHYMADQQL